MLVKICGITTTDEIDLLVRHNVDWLGLWFSMENGRSNLCLNEFQNLSHYTGENLQVVGVTTDGRLDTLLDYIEIGHMQALQLHGFQTPALISKLKKRHGHDLMLIKTLHVSNEGCLESAMLNAYIAAGVDYFLLDYYGGPETVGSTGIRVSKEELYRLAKYVGLDKSIFAGGLSPEDILGFKRYGSPAGVDVDSYAKENGVINEERVRSIVEAA